MQEQRAERDSLPAWTFAPGPGLEKTTGDHGRTSSPGYRDSETRPQRPQWLTEPRLFICIVCIDG